MIETTAQPEPSITTQSGDPLHLWSGLNSAPQAQAWVESHLQASRDRIADLLAPSASRSAIETLALYDQAAWHLRMAGSQAHVMFMVHPAADVRDSAQALSQLVAAEGVKLSLNRDVFKALESLDVSNEDAATRYYLERTLLGYRLAGVDRDDATREKIRELADRSTELGMRFARTVQDDVRKIEVADPNELRGLPADFLERFGV
ncbi:MAG TPA: peptidase M3, partial [Acidobacteriaceae bacterium]